MNIRQEQEKDYIEIYKVVKESFESALQSDGDEQNLVTRLRESQWYIPELALVAEIENKIVGYIMITETMVGNSKQLILAPLAILPEYQNKGIGSKLIGEAHRVAKEMKYDFVILVGHDTYYPRFGYKKAKEFDIRSPIELPEEVFMAYPLHGEKKLHATIEYAKEFGL